MHHPHIAKIGALSVLAAAASVIAVQAGPTPTVDPEHGHEVAIHGTAMDEMGKELAANLPASFFDIIWQVWDGEDGERAKTATPEERRKIAYNRYGFVDAPFENQGLPAGMLPKGDHIAETCLLCHSGSAAGQPVLGLGNAKLDFQTLMEDSALLGNLFMNKPITRPVPGLPVGSLFAGTDDGLGMALGLISLRNPDLSMRDLAKEGPVNLGQMQSAFSKVPAWWNLKHKDKYYYSDGLAPATYRTLMNAEMWVSHTKEYIESREQDFRDMHGYLKTLQAPKYPGSINTQLAARGKRVFETKSLGHGSDGSVRTCASCHGTYGSNGHYEQKIIPISVIGTDDLHLVAYTKEARAMYSNGWFGFMGQKPGAEPKGYIPPPLDGVWATAPYFHNGSVPTLEGVLWMDKRPAVWKAVRDVANPANTYDLAAVGLKLEPNVTSIPSGLTSSEYRKYYDTSVRGFSADGHYFPETLSDSDREAVLEYLKTL